MVFVNTHEAKTRLSALLGLVEEKHEVVTICRNGKPVARLVAIDERTPDPFQRNPALGPVVFHEDPCAPLDEDAWPEEAR